AAVHMKDRIGRVAVPGGQIDAEPPEVGDVAQAMQRCRLLHLLLRAGHQVETSLQTVGGEGAQGYRVDADLRRKLLGHRTGERLQPALRDAVRGECADAETG